MRAAIRAFLAIWLIGLAGAAFAGKRVALVIGNSNYTLAPLDNPKHDAEDIAAALKRLSFQVTAVTDLTIRDFDRAIDAFESAAKDADVALFFFSGHGVQIDKRGYLAPIDLKAETESSALRELVAIQEVVSRIENAAKVSVIVLDACRDSPLQERMRRISAEKYKGLIPAKGLAPPSVVGSNTLIVYATVPGETASDGAGRNSPFTASLLKNIETPGLEIELMFKHVTADVLAATRGKQQPERLSRLQTELILLPGRPEAPLAPDAQAWGLVQSTASEAVLEEFIRRFPESVYAGFAKARLEELKRGKVASKGASASSLGPLSSGQRPESERPEETKMAVAAPPKPTPTDDSPRIELIFVDDKKKGVIGRVKPLSNLIAFVTQDKFDMVDSRDARFKFRPDQHGFLILSDLNVAEGNIYIYFKLDERDTVYRYKLIATPAYVDINSSDMLPPYFSTSRR